MQKKPALAHLATRLHVPSLHVMHPARRAPAHARSLPSRTVKRAPNAARGLFIASTILVACSSGPDDSAPGVDDGTGGDHASASGGKGTSPSSGGANTASGGKSEGASSGGSPGSGGASSSGGTVSSGGGSLEGTGGVDASGWQLVWADEFDGSAIDPQKWEHEVNCWGGGNNEDQCYVADAKNSFIKDGNLHIVALKDQPSGPEGGGSGSDAIVSKGHSSARLRTINKGDFTYGRIEARLKLPFGQGIWPAFWMLPTDEVYGAWASSGEIDIMEAVNLNPDNEVHGTLHFGGMWPDNTSKGTSTTLASPAWEDFHVFAVEWEEGEVRWFVDQKHYATQTEWDSQSAPYPAPFNQRFHIILNLAVGGNWPGPPDGTTTFPQEYLVDYVRVFSCPLDSSTGHGCGSSDPEIAPF